MKRVILSIGCWVLVASCTVVKQHTLANDYVYRDQKSLKRITIAVESASIASEKTREMFARMAHRYVNMKRDFLVLSHSTHSALPDFQALCVDTINGILMLGIETVDKGQGFEAQVKAQLLRCQDKGLVWSADAAGSFRKYDAGLKEIAQNYGREIGEEVQAYVPTAMNLLRPTLDTLPQPILTEDDISEKMSLDE